MVHATDPAVAASDPHDPQHRAVEAPDAEPPDAEPPDAEPPDAEPLDAESLARQTIADPSTAAAVAAMIDLMGVLHQRRTLHQHGAPARALLVHLARCGAMRPADLAAAVNLDQSTISRHLGQLAAAGMVERDADPWDRRACVMRVTPAGRRAAAEVICRRIAEVADILDSWTPQERDDFARLLARFTHAVDSMSQATAPPSTEGP